MAAVADCVLTRPPYVTGSEPGLGPMLGSATGYGGSFMLTSTWGYVRQWWEDHWVVLLIACSFASLVLVMVFADSSPSHTPADYPANAHPLNQVQYDDGPSSDEWDEFQNVIWEQEAP